MTDIKVSRRALLQLAGGASTALLAGSLPTAWGQGAPKRSASATFQNPLFAGDFSDPTILRVGEDFYFTHNFYRYAPALVVWHSRDLVNWTPISHVVNDSHSTPGEIWSPDFVYHEGRYYIYFPMGGIHVVHAEHPSGPWSEVISVGINDIDPGHVVGPDGTRYLYTAGGHVTQLSADGLSAVGERQQVYKGWQFPADWKTEGFWLESPKLTRRGAYYYLICAQGGTAGPPTSHMSVVARSTSPLGPWENSPHNPLIHTYSADEAWWSVGHGTLVSTPDDRWYFVYHGYRNGLQSLGRNTLMEPIEWTPDGWPVAPLGARRGEPMPAPMGVAQRPMIPLSDDFQGPNLKLTWGAWDEADLSRFGVGHGALTMRAKGDSPGHSSPLTVMARDPSYQVQVTATADAGSSPALGLFYSPNHWLFSEINSNGIRVYSDKQTLASSPWQGNTAHLRIVNRRNQVEFLASADGRTWTSLAANVDTSGYVQNSLGGFEALRPALATTGMGTARFANFVYQSLPAA